MNDFQYYRDLLGWQPSFGEDLNAIHLRNGHEHAKFDSTTGELLDIHFDKHDPHESIPELVNHVWDSDLGRAALIIGGLYLLDKYSRE